MSSVRDISAYRPYCPDCPWEWAVKGDGVAYIPDINKSIKCCRVQRVMEDCHRIMTDKERPPCES